MVAVVIIIIIIVLLFVVSPILESRDYKKEQQKDHERSQLIHEKNRQEFANILSDAEAMKDQYYNLNIVKSIVSDVESIAIPSREYGTGEMEIECHVWEKGISLYGGGYRKRYVFRDYGFEDVKDTKKIFAIGLAVEKSLDEVCQRIKARYPKTVKTFKKDENKTRLDNWQKNHKENSYRIKYKIQVIGKEYKQL